MIYIFAPILSWALIVYIQFVVDSFIKYQNNDPKVIFSSKLPKCTPSNDWTTLGFSIIDPTIKDFNKFRCQEPDFNEWSTSSLLLK